MLAPQVRLEALSLACRTDMFWGESFVALVFCGPRRFVCDFPHAREEAYPTNSATMAPRKTAASL